MNELAKQLVRHEIGRWLWLAMLILAFLVPVSQAAGNQVNTPVYLFWSDGCPHCERELDFLQRQLQMQPQLTVHAFEISGDADNRALMRKVVEAFGIADPAVPLTIIGNRVWIGYASDATTGAEMQQRITFCAGQQCPDAIAALIGSDTQSSSHPAQEAQNPLPETLNLPLLGEVAPRTLSLPVLTVMLGALDGFNPCAMWTLVFLIGLLLGMKDTVRMWTLGGVFILGSAVVYFAFMAAWLNLFLVLGSLLAIRVVIGLVALGGGAYYLREYILNKDAVCAVTASERRQRILQRLKDYAGERNFLLALLGILALAVIVNLVELVCSAGIPAVYTQILSMHALPTWQYYGYLLLYILTFMADDLLVFFTAMQTLRISGLTTRYSRYSHLVGGVMLVLIGVLMLLRPDLLMFG